MSQSSLFLQATEPRGTIAGGSGRDVGGSVGGRFGSSAIGGSIVPVGPGIGLMIVSAPGGLSPATGLVGGTGLSTARAEHLMVGLPMVPGGHVQVAMCSTV